jgi:serine/threonine protein kinase
MRRRTSHCSYRVEPQIVHRDVKPANILVSRAIAPPLSTEAPADGPAGDLAGAGGGPTAPQSRDGTVRKAGLAFDGTLPDAGAAAAPLVKLCDFGFARNVYCSEPWYGEQYSSYVVTRYYRAPEVRGRARHQRPLGLYQRAFIHNPPARDQQHGNKGGAGALFWFYGSGSAVFLGVTTVTYGPRNQR